MRRSAGLVPVVVVALAWPGAAYAGEPAGPVTCFGRPATVVGTDGDDVLRGTDGPDVVVALGGDDLVLARGGDDAVCAGDGRDVVDAGAGDDEVSGGATIDELAGGDGDDELLGGGGSDRLDGGDGADVLLPQGGGFSEVADGGPGDDTIVADEFSVVYATGGPGADWFQGYGLLVDYGSAPGPVTVDLAAGTATGDGADRLTGVTTVDGSPFGDTVRCGTEPCTVRGEAGNDRLVGGRGRDQLVPGAGDDTVVGGDGDDRVGFGSHLAMTVDLAAGTATGEGDDRLRDVENVTTGWRDDVLVGDGGGNVLEAGGGANVVRGLGGNDELYVSGGPNDLHGGPGNDTLLAFGNHDSCNGGTGRDVAYECEREVNVP